MYTKLNLMKLNAPPLTAPLPLHPVLPSCTQRFLQGYRGQYFPHLRPRRGILDRRLQLPRSRTTGPERRRFAFHHGLPPAPTLVGGVYGYLDHLPKGRNETGPGHKLPDWVRHHDRYD
jgi:hypothetical protein